MNQNNNLEELKKTIKILQEDVAKIKEHISHCKEHEKHEKHKEHSHK